MSVLPVSTARRRRGGWRHVLGAGRRLDGDIAQGAALAGQVAAAAAVALAEAGRVGPQGLDLAREQLELAAAAAPELHS
jgi:hypothetical protein